jgi:protein KRI1
MEKGGDLEASESDVENMDLFQKGNKETMAEEEARIKAEFKKAAAGETSSSHSSSASDNDILIKKNKSNHGQEDSEQEEAPKSRIKEMQLQTDEDILKQIYGNDKNMDKTDKFLRNFILSEGWKDKKKDIEEDHYRTYQDKNEKIDKEDSDRDLEMDIYEHQHNFRFEDKNAAYLTTHAREAPEDSMRRVDDTRRQTRLSAKERKDEDKQKRKEEINKLKALKREEIMNQLKQTEFIAGGVGQKSIFENKKVLEKAERELQTEFIPDLYDKAMEQMFGGEYYNASDDDSVELEKQKDVDMQLLGDKDVTKIGHIEDDEIGLEQNVADIDEDEFLDKQRQAR